MSKVFHPIESQSLELRGDSFNAGNMASHGAPTASLNSSLTGAFGRITSTNSSQRVLQVSAHYRF